MLSLIQQTELTTTGWLPPLVHDYLMQKKEISFLWKYSPDIHSFKQIIADKKADHTDRNLLVQVINKQYLNKAVTDPVANNIQLLLHENTYTVTAAHQPCLFLGPLYNIYKIACTIHLAGQLKRAYPASNFVPVFWLGSEDHDVDELNHTFIKNEKITWQQPGTGAAGRWNTATLKAVFDELKNLLPEADILEKITQGLNRFKSFGTFTRYIIHEIFKEHGLVVIDGDDEQLKQQLVSVIKEEVEQCRAIQVLKQSIEFLSAHYKVQAIPRDINFFYLGDNFRERIIYNAEAEMFEVNNTALRFTAQQMADEIENFPERFSPNVIYRPVFQELILPNLAFVGGSGELSYWLELQPLFEHYKINYPMLVMRNSAAIVPASVHTKLKKLNLQPTSFFKEVETLVNEYVQQQSAGFLSLAEQKNQLAALFETVAQKVTTVDITLKQSALAEKQKSMTALENLEAKMLKAEKRKNETAVNQIRNIHSTLFPDGNLQERKENFLSFYSANFVQVLVNEMNPLDKKFKFFGKE